MKILGSISQLLRGTNTVDGKVGSRKDPAATGENPKSAAVPADRAAITGCGANVHADLRAYLSEPAGATASSVASRPRRSRKPATALLLVGLLGIGAWATQIGHGERIAADAVAADLPTIGKNPDGVPRPIDVAGTVSLPSPGGASASTRSSIAAATMPRVEDRRDISLPAGQQAGGDDARRPTERTNVAPMASASEPQAPVRGSRLEIGDKLKIAFYERVDDVEKDKWGRAGSGLQGFQQRPELSGEYAVQDDGTISLPLLGSLAATELSSAGLQAALASSFEKLTGRKGLVTVLSLERPPVYVLGPVKSPGSYKYVPGMTVLHAVALAGGFDRQNVEPWQRVEAVREVEKRRGSIEIMLKAVARAAIVKAERDGRAVQVPPLLLQTVSEAEAKSLIADESARRAPIVAARRSRERALSVSADAAKQEVQMLSNRLQPVDDLIKLRADRANAMRSLLQQGTISNLVMVQAQSELSDAQQRRQDAVNQYAMARQRAAMVEQEQAKFQADTGTEIETEILAAEQQIAANEREFATSDGILGALRLTPVRDTPSSGTAGNAYEVVRQKGTAGPVALPAGGMTTLQPGDLVRVIGDNERGRADPELQPTQRSPGSSAADASSPGKSDSSPARGAPR